MSKSGEAWIKSPEKQAFEKTIVASLLPAIGGITVSAAAVLRVSQRDSRVLQSIPRSLYPGHVFTMKKLGDPDSNSRVQRLFRQAMIDELPQAANILRGSMSLFGPRADKPSHIEELFGAIEDENLRDRWLEARSKQKPGIISSYAIYSHTHNLEGTSEYTRFSAEEVLTLNALDRATRDIHDFENTSLAYDLGLLKGAGQMAVGNYQHYAQLLFQLGTPAEAI
jgi:hypothetical protein